MYLPDFQIVEKRKASAEAIIVKFLNIAYRLLLTTGLQFILHTQNIRRVSLRLLYFIVPLFQLRRKIFSLPFENIKYPLH